MNSPIITSRELASEHRRSSILMSFSIFKHVPEWCQWFDNRLWECSSLFTIPFSIRDHLPCVFFSPLKFLQGVVAEIKWLKEFVKSSKSKPYQVFQSPRKISRGNPSVNVNPQVWVKNGPSWAWVSLSLKIKQNIHIHLNNIEWHYGGFKLRKHPIIDK